MLLHIVMIKREVLKSPLNNQRHCEASCSEKKYGVFWELFDTLRSLENGRDENLLSMEPPAPVLKVLLKKNASYCISSASGRYLT